MASNDANEPHAPRTRRDKLLAGIDLRNSFGIEVGPLAAPLVRKEDGPIYYVDHADAESLRLKYRNDPAVNTEEIVDVDGVWGSQTLRDCLGAGVAVDYVVASHVVEHVPDLITWLGEIRSVLRPTGTLRLAVPDRRYTFDYMRRESQLPDVLDAHIRRARAPLPRMLLDHFGFVRVVSLQQAWDGTLDPTTLPICHSWTDAVAIASSALVEGAYHDCHCWVFTPASFAGLFVQLSELELIGFECETFWDTGFGELEFFVHLRPTEDNARIQNSWREMAQAFVGRDR